MAELFKWSLGGACDLGAFQVLELLLHWQRHLPRLFLRQAGPHGQVHRASVCGLTDAIHGRFPRVLRLRELSLPAGRGDLRMLVLLAWCTLLTAWELATTS